MADTYLNYNGKLIKLVDLGDGTFGIAIKGTVDTEGLFHALAPVKGGAIGGGFLTDDPAYNDGDLTIIRTNAKGEIIIQSGSEGSFHALAPTKGDAIGGVYLAENPTYNDGDMTIVRTNSKGEIIVEANIAPTVEPVATDFEALAITNAVAVALTEAKIANKVKAMITVETAEIRWRIDGTAPTTTVGHMGAKGDIIMLTNATDIGHFKAIATSATAASLSITYFE